MFHKSVSLSGIFFFFSRAHNNCITEIYSENDKKIEGFVTLTLLTSDRHSHWLAAVFTHFVLLL